MLKEKMVSLTLTQDDVEYLADGQTLEDDVDNGLVLELDLDEDAADWINNYRGQEELNLAGDEPTIPEDLDDLHYQEELLPLAGAYNVIEDTGKRSRDALTDELERIRDSQS